MGDKSILNKKNITKNDICDYLLSDCVDIYKSRVFDHDMDDMFLSDDEDDQIAEDIRRRKQQEDEGYDELLEAQQRQWDEQEEYEKKLADIEDRYPGFDAKEAALFGEDPEEAEQRAMLDDFSNWW